MDISAASMQMNLSMLQSAMSTSILNKAMNCDTQGMSILLQDFSVANPVQAPVSFGLMDIRV